MITNDHLTDLIRKLFIAGENEERIPQAQAAYQEMVGERDTWKLNNSESTEMPAEIARIQSALDYLDGKTVSIKNDPWIVVSQIQMNFENREGEIDLMPAMQVAGLIRDWEGEDGQEPDWMIEGDRLLCKHWYPDMMTGIEIKGTELEDYLSWTPRERAAAFNLLG